MELQQGVGNPQGGFFGTETPEQSRQRNSEAPEAQRPGPGLIESLGLGFRRGGAQEDWGFNQVNWEMSTFDEVKDAMRERGVAIPGVPYSIIAREIGVTELHAANVDIAAGRDSAIRRAVEGFFGLVRQEQDRDPRFLPHHRDIRDPASFTSYVQRQRSEEVARIDAQAEGGSNVGSFIGQMGHGFTDPTSYIPGIGQSRAVGQSLARQIVGTAGREAVANMAITAATEPLVRQDARSLGIERTAGDFLFDLGVAGGTGGAIGAGGHVAGHVIAQAVPLPHQAASALRADVRALGADPDAELPAIFRTPGAPLSPVERAAGHVVTRDAQVRAGSPFLPGPHGEDEHYSWLDRAMAGLNRDTPAPASAPRPIRRGDVADGSADLARTRRPQWEIVKARIAAMQGPGAVNRASGAAGTGDFLASTWVPLYRRRYPRDTRSDAQVAALRSNPAMVDQLMNDSLGLYEQQLSRAGLPADAGNLYLAHAVGPGVAVAMLRNPNVPAQELIRASVVRSRGADGARRFASEAIANNPHLRGTAGEAAAWARQQMAGGPSTGSGQAARGGSRFATRVDAIVHLGQQLESQGLIVGENRHVGNRHFTAGDHQTGQAHGEYMLDVNDAHMPPGSPQIEARNPEVRARFDRMALEAQAQGYRILWNEHIYEPHANGPGRRIPGADSDSRQHRNHIHFEAPQSLVGADVPGGAAPGAGPALADAGDGIPAAPDVAMLEQAHFDVREQLGIGSEPGRPILRPDLFGSPELHAAAQRRFEAMRDAADGYAPVRDGHEIGFDAVDYLDRLHERARGSESLQPEAVAQALNITPAQARQVAELLASSEDSPITIARRGDKAGQVQRRTVPERGPQSLLDFLSERGGIEDIGGELAAMDAGQWHRGAVGRRQLIRQRSAEAVRGQAESIALGPDMSFAAAIEAGYFPEHAGLRDAIGAGRYDDLPDLGQFHGAIDRELRGAPVHVPEDLDAVTAAARADADPELRARMDEIAAAANESFGVALDHDDAVLQRAAEISADPRFDGGLADAWVAAAERIDDELADAALARTGKEVYDDGDGADNEPGPEDGEAGVDRGRSGDAASGAADGGRTAEDLSFDPAGAERGGDFDSPIGASAKAQADSLAHDLEMQAKARSGDEAANARYRFDEDGEEMDVAQALADLRDEQGAIDAMRDCMIPGKGDGE